MICVSRVGRDPSAVPALVELAETLGAQVMADGYRVNIPADHPLAFSGGPMSGPPPDVDCFLVLDMLVPWAMHDVSAGPERAHHHAGDRPDPSHDDDLRVPERPGDQRRRGRVAAVVARRGSLGDDRGAARALRGSARSA